jgi:hypothetical protein
VAGEFGQACDANYKILAADCRNKYQQFFFRVRDDTDYPVTDYFLDFVVLDENGRRDDDLTAEFDEHFESEFYTHSADAAYRVMMVDYDRLKGFCGRLIGAKAKLTLDLTAKTPLPDVKYVEAKFVVFDGAREQVKDICFFFPNTTTLVDIVLDRAQTDGLLRVLARNEMEDNG